MTAAQVQGRPCQALALGPAARGWPGLRPRGWTLSSAGLEVCCLFPSPPWGASPSCPPRLFGTGAHLSPPGLGKAVSPQTASPRPGHP